MGTGGGGDHGDDGVTHVRGDGVVEFFLGAGALFKFEVG